MNSFQKSVFTPNVYVFTGLVARMYRFDVTARAEVRRLENTNASIIFEKYYIEEAKLRF